MAILTLNSDQKTDGYRSVPTEDHGKLRIQYFSVPALAAQADVGSTINLCDLPSGRVRVLPGLSKVNNSAFGGAATLDIGLRAYNSRDDQAGIVNAEDPVALANLLPVAQSNVGQSFNMDLKVDLYSKSGVTAFATIAGSAMPVAGTLSGYIVYVYE